MIKPCAQSRAPKGRAATPQPGERAAPLREQQTAVEVRCGQLAEAGATAGVVAVRLVASERKMPDLERDKAELEQHTRLQVQQPAVSNTALTGLDATLVTTQEALEERKQQSTGSAARLAETLRTLQEDARRMQEKATEHERRQEDLMAEVASTHAPPRMHTPAHACLCLHMRAAHARTHVYRE